ncbi:hypothetical protein [Pontixanthobacter aquaemixtae]|uniref:C-type lysozyme inhibitor domain-containing protein n=1 Tax=Pontixanthobacter aquaemixtae TaxID=1958940 RepID=A0A844ZQI2_9SPHN|nr:hypothetical protein [Pontixanthobacter aquaemixtae]MXO90008.1 hypothetical protein [Pontixanthobacter aquaemixtae]
MRNTTNAALALVLAAGTIAACAEPVDPDRAAKQAAELAQLEEAAREPEADPAEAEGDEAAGDSEAADAKRLDCEPLGDSAVWIETGEDGEHTLVTHMQSEMAPDAEPVEMAIEATGASAGREGSRLTDENGEYVVWIMDDGTATVKAGENEVSCPAA